MSTTVADNPTVTIVVDGGEALVGIECGPDDYFDPGMYELAGVKWASWSTAPDYIPVETRLNIDLTEPARLVYRNGKKVNEAVGFRLPTRAEFSQLCGFLDEGDLYTYKVLVTTVAVKRDDYTTAECAAVSGFAEKALEDEALGWGAAVELGLVRR